MSHLFKRLKHPAACLLISLCAAVSLSFTLLFAVLHTFPAGLCIAFCLLGALMLVVPVALPRFKLIPFILFAVSQLIALIFHAGLMYETVQLFRAVMLYSSGQTAALLPWLDVLAGFVSFVAGVLCAEFVIGRMNGCLMMTGLAVLGVSLWFTGGEGTLLLYALPFFLVCLLQLTHTDTGLRLSALPVTAALLLIAFLIAPGALTSAPLREHAEAVRSEVEDRLRYTGERKSFSLSDYGYIPLQTRLGGPASPSDQAVLQVDTESTVYLRAVTCDTYNGRFWYDTVSARRYLYDASSFRQIRDRIFEADYPLTAARTAEKQVTVTLLSECTTTLFAPQRFSSEKMLGRHMILYFNDASELFITRSLTAGDSYAFTFTGYIAGDPVTGQIVRACEQVDDPEYQQISAVYTALPDHLCSVDSAYLRELSAEAAGGAQMPYDKAMNIAAWLKNNYTYTLDAPTPEEGYDFFAYFLVTAREGYCTSFATAMTLLCRMQGIPARYVTGFLVNPENGTATVTGADAHAWTEIYLNGFGWLTIDATPASGEGDQRVTDPDHGTENGAPGENTPVPVTPTPAPQTPDPSADRSDPTPTPTPAPTPSPDHPSPSPEGTTPSPVPTVTPSVSPTPAPDAQDPSAEPPEPPAQPPHFPWLLLLLLAVLVGIALRLFLTEPSRAVRRHPAKAGKIAAAALEHALHRCGLRRRKNETLREFFARAGAAPGLQNVPLTPALEQLEQNSYSSRRADARVLLQTYRAVRATLSARGRFCLALSRLPFRASRRGTRP